MNFMFCFSSKIFHRATLKFGAQKAASWSRRTQQDGGPVGISCSAADLRWGHAPPFGSPTASQLGELYVIHLPTCCHAHIRVLESELLCVSTLHAFQLSHEPNEGSQAAPTLVCMTRCFSYNKLRICCDSRDRRVVGVAALAKMQIARCSFSRGIRDCTHDLGPDLKQARCMLACAGVARTAMPLELLWWVWPTLYSHCKCL